MLRKSLLCCLLALGTLGWSQTAASRFEIFGGISAEHVALCGRAGGSCNSESGEGPVPTTAPGWNVSATGYFYKSFGVTADFAGHGARASIPTGGPGNSAHVSDLSYLFGPVYAYRKPSFSLFAHTLFGVFTRRVDPIDIRRKPFAWLIGGGLDANAARHVAIRLGQFDYEHLNLPQGADASPISVSGWRYSGGIVLKF